MKAGVHNIPPGTIKLHLLYNIYAENKRENMKSVQNRKIMSKKANLLLSFDTFYHTAAKMPTSL